jgi:hypothetical protein
LILDGEGRGRAGKRRRRWDWLVGWYRGGEEGDGDLILSDFNLAGIRSRKKQGILQVLALISFIKNMTT